MFVAGDEFMQTQGGNNNPYNQDNETTWLNWDLQQTNAEMLRFFSRMIAFRKAHPTLGRSRYWREDVRWYGVGAQVDSSFSSRSLAFYLDGSALHDQDIDVMINAYWESLNFTLQVGQASDWRRVVDTRLPSPQDIAEPGQETALASLQYSVGPRSVAVFIRAA